jgi:phosphate transport system substrate-binding protein
MTKKLSYLALTAILMLSACSSDRKAELSGAGATFPQPFYNVVFGQFAKNTGINVSYGAIGSGGGVRSLKDKTVDFGASDAYLSDEDAKNFGTEMVHIPAAMGAVVMCYNLPGVKGLKLTADIISDIYRDKITHWNDTAIRLINPSLTLPDMKITVVYRSDGSGTTFNFSDCMSKANPEWKNEIGTDKTLNINASGANIKIAAKGNSGVAGIISQTEGSIGYVGSEYAFAMDLDAALLKNAAGNFIKANSQSISAAANGEMPDDMRILITNSPNPDAYPIACFTWIIIYKEQNYNRRTAKQAQALVDLLKYVTSAEGQAFAEKTHYAPISVLAKEKTEELLKSITYNGESIE